MLLLISLIILYLIKKQLSTFWRNIYLFFVNSCWFIFLPKFQE